MPTDVQIASPPPKPLLIFDGDCGFCRRWIARWERATGDAVTYAPYQSEEISKQYPQIPPEDFAEAVHLILPDGSVCRGAEAVFRSLAAGGRERWMLWCYLNLRAFRELTELVYEEVATHRQSLSKVDRFLFGPGLVAPRYTLVRSAFLRGLALIYLIAFASLWSQIQGLVGSQGINPVAIRMATMQHEATVRSMGWDRFHLAPTLAWWAASDSALNWQCAAGVVLAALLLLGIAPAPVLFLLWLVYLSLSTVAQPFLNFQWDNLLLETGFLAIFFAPCQLLDRPSRQPPPSLLALWLLRWLIFRLMLESGSVKLMSADPSWWNLTALRVHFETQPLPTWLGWYAHQLPHGVLSLATFLLFVIELGAPVLIFVGRKSRQVAAVLFIFLQVIIMLTGNYAFFNWLTILLCVPLLDDAVLEKLAPKRWRDWPLVREGRRWPWKLTAPLAIVIVLLTSVPLFSNLRLVRAWPRPLLAAYVWLEPLRSFGGYGLFANMTQLRPEIVIEGSNDGQTWVEYEFKDKPGDAKRRPSFVAPLQPRLDWQMWFAALAVADERQWWLRPENQWFLQFEHQLLQNSPPVVGLLERNPFPKNPPKFVRALLYEYHFTDRTARAASGAWWKRELKGVCVPPISLSSFQPRN